MADATILIPTHRHAELLPFAVRSALAQEGVDIELFVVGDGVEDDTREALEPFLSDARVRFFDRPKGAARGELLRHEALLESMAPIVCYLSDDDLFLPGHVATTRELLVDADVAQDPPVVVRPDGTLHYYAFNLGRPEFLARLAEGVGGGGLTWTSHTRAFYERLPFGWRPAPPGKPTDIHMFQQFLLVPGFRGITSERLTSLCFPSVLRGHMTAAERAAELEHWERRLAEAAFSVELDRLTMLAARAAAERLKLDAARLEQELERVRRTRWWRLRRALAEAAPVRGVRRG